MAKLKLNIDKKFKEAEVIVNASKKDEMIELIEQIVNNGTNSLLGYKDNKIYVINTDEIVKITSGEKNNYCHTLKDTFNIKETLSYLESTLNSNYFIRISNSCIINIAYVEYFDVSIVGNILVVFKDKTSETVSKRKIKSVMDFLKKRKSERK